MKPDIEKLKTAQLDMLKQFIEICNNHSFLYFVVGGTALGAVRHKGFIPWDDDIDVALPREDYEKFLSVAQKSLPDFMFLQTYVTDKDYPHVFAKIRNNNTAFIEKSVSRIRINHGVYIDIFPLDGYPKAGIRETLFKIKRNIFAIPISQAFSSNRASSGNKTILEKIVLKLFPDYHTAVKKLDMLLKKCPYKDSNIVGNLCGVWGKKEIMPKEFFGKGTEGKFEGLKVILPEKTHEYLSALYGNYMELPPIEKRVGHHYCTVIDLEKSYEEYIQIKSIDDEGEIKNYENKIRYFLVGEIA